LLYYFLYSFFPFCFFILYYHLLIVKLDACSLPAGIKISYNPYVLTIEHV